MNAILQANWTRWIFATLSKHFNDAAVAASVPMFIEGQDRGTALLPEYFEFRMNGPRCHEVSRDYWHLDIEINILVIQKRNEKTNHRIFDLCGVILAACVHDIPAFKYGTGLNDNPTESLGCLTLSSHLDDNILVTHLGQLNPDLVEIQSAVETYYRLELET